MKTKSTLSKGLAMLGTLFVWLPILAPILFSVIALAYDGVFRFDYLMPAELGLFAFGGGVLLLVAAFLAHANWKWIGWGLGIALLSVVGGQALAVVTGLASGETEPVGWPWMLVIGSLIVYTLAVVEVGVEGIRLLRDLFKSPPLLHSH